MFHPRFQRFVRFALGTGCRDEIRGITPERDVDWLRGTVHVRGKFGKERDIPMQPDAPAKIPSITPHVLRHTFGTRWFQAGDDICRLSKILEHSSVAVTEAQYAHLLKEDLVAASQQVEIPVAPRGEGNVVKMPCRRA